MVERKLENSIDKNLDNDYILIIVGARQVGKTFLLKKLSKKLFQSGKKVYFHTLEDPEILSDLNSHPENIFNYIPKNEKLFLLLDEIQYLKNPTNFLKYIYDLYSDNVKLIVTGSSAFYIDRKFKDSLAGRKRIFILNTFSFAEFLIAKRRNDLTEFIRTNFFHNKTKTKYPKNIKRELIIYLNEYIKFGGYPRVVLEEDKNEKILILKELYSSFLKKDITEYGIKNEIAFFKLLKILAHQIGNLANVNELAKTLNIAYDTVKNYLYLLEKSFIIKSIQPFSNNVRKELTKMNKYYFYDLGFRNVLFNRFDELLIGEQGGNFLENLFFKFIIDNGIEDIKFWRTIDKKEIDFIIDEKYAFEIKLNPENVRARKYSKFIEKYPEIKFNFVTFNSASYLDICDFLDF